MLIYEPNSRISAKHALNHPYFNHINTRGVVTGGGCHSTASATDFEASNKGMLHCVYFLTVSEANIRFINKHYPLPSKRDH